MIMTVLNIRESTIVPSLSVRPTWFLHYYYHDFRNKGL